jgi:hypothetical protein
MMEAARTSETLVNFYQTKRCYNPEDSHLHTHRRENLKSYLEWWSLEGWGRTNAFWGGLKERVLRKCLEGKVGERSLGGAGEMWERKARVVRDFLLS